MSLLFFTTLKILRWVPKDMRRQGVLESLKDQNVAAVLEEADYVENSGYYDQDGNWVYYDEYNQENQQPQPPKPQTQPQPEPVQNGLKPAQTAKPQAKPQAQQAQAEAAQAAQEAAQAAQEAAQAAKGLMKGITGFGKSSGFSLGGLMKTVAAEPAQPAVQKKPVQPAKPKPKPQDPNFPKPCTNNMTAKQRWHWAHRRIVQVFFQ